jgi:hypothetical protein
LEEVSLHTKSRIRTNAAVQQTQITLSAKSTL